MESEIARLKGIIEEQKVDQEEQRAKHRAELEERAGIRQSVGGPQAEGKGIQ